MQELAIQHQKITNSKNEPNVNSDNNEKQQPKFIDINIKKLNNCEIQKDLAVYSKSNTQDSVLNNIPLKQSPKTSDHKFNEFEQESLNK